MTKETENQEPPVLGAEGVAAAVLAALAHPAYSRPKPDDKSSGDGDPRETPPANDRLAGKGKDNPKSSKDDEDGEIILKRARLDTNDYGFARRLADYEGDDVIFAEQLGWMAWNGVRYDRESGEAGARRKVIGLIDKIKFTECKALKGDVVPIAPEVAKEAELDEDTQIQISKNKMTMGMHKALWKAAKSLGNSSTQKSVLDTAAQLTEFRVPFDDLDADGFKLNCANGVLDLRTATSFDDLKLRPAVPSDRLTRVTAAPYDIKAGCPEWEKHLMTVFPDAQGKDGAAMRGYVQRVLGSFLVSHNPRNKFILFQGPGGDGKSTTVNAVFNVMGVYGQAADIKTFLHDPRPGGSGPSENLVRMAGGVRFIRTGEPAAKAQLSESIIKQCTGGEKMTARAGHGKEFEYAAQFKTLVQCNSKPKIHGDDRGIWRRLEIVPFREFITDIDTKIDEKLAAEGSGILNYLIEGYLDWKSLGFDYDTPELAREALVDYRITGNPWAAWYEARIVAGRWWPKQDGFLPRDEWADDPRLAKDGVEPEMSTDELVRPRYAPKDIWADCQAYCAENELDAGYPNPFHKWFGEKGFRSVKSGGNRYRVGFDFIDGRIRTPKKDRDEN